MSWNSDSLYKMQEQETEVRHNPKTYTESNDNDTCHDEMQAKDLYQQVLPLTWR